MASRLTTLYTSQYDLHQPFTNNGHRRKTPTTSLNIPCTTPTTTPSVSSSTTTSMLTQQEDKAMTRECLLFPTYAYRNPKDHSEWVIRTRGWALSHNRSQAKQKIVTSLTKGVVGQNSGDHATFEERFKYFLAKNKRNKHFIIQAVGTHPLPFETWDSSSPTTSTSSSSSSSALPITPTDNIRMTLDQHQRDSDGSTDSGFQSAGVFDKTDHYNHFYRHPLHHRSSNSGSDEDEMIPAAVLDMERPINPLSSILSGQRMRSTTSLSSSLLSTSSNDSKQYHGDNDDDDDDYNDDGADDDDIDNNDSNNAKNIETGNKIKDDHYLTNNTTRSDSSTTTTLSSLFNYPSFTNSSTTSNSSTHISLSLSNNMDSKVDGQAIFKSETSGFFSGPTHLSHQQVLQWAKERNCCDARLLELRSSPFNDQHLTHPTDIGLFPESSGMVNLVEPTGISIISDIDDTIKETQILHGARTVLNNTFFNPSKGVSGMAEAYMKWYTQGASFHYVSNSPFQLLPFLHNFLNTARFPPGSMHLRLDGTLMARLIEIPGRAKRDAILSIMRDFPRRQFILVGDSGEADLEIYTKIALENPGRILKIFIHDVTTPYAERKKRNKKSAPSSPSTNTKSPTIPTTTTNPDSDGPTSPPAASLTHLPGDFVRNSSMSFSSFFQSHSSTSCGSIITSNHPSPNLPLPSTTSSTSLVDSDQHTPKIRTTVPQKHHRNKTNSLLDLASSITSSSVLGIGRGRTKTLAELIIEPASSSSSCTSSAITSTLGTSIPPSQQCIQLYDRIRKAQDQLSHNVDVVLFKNADDLRDDTTIQEALWQHWDDQCINTSV